MSALKLTTMDRKLHPLTLSELLAMPMTPREFLLTPWFKEGHSALLWAPSGVGKTFLSLTIALAVAGGGEFLGWHSPRSRKVLVIDGEMHLEDLRDRCAALLNSVEGIDRNAAGKNLTILARQAQHPDAPFPDLAEPEGREEVMRRIASEQYALVILDNFSTLATVEDENAAHAMNPVLQFLWKFKQAGCACILVHHSGKGGDRYRGSSKLETTFEAILGLRKLDDSPFDEPTGARFHMKWDKYRDQRGTAMQERTVSLVSDDDGRRLRWDAASRYDPDLLRLVSAWKSCRYDNQKSLADALGKSTGWVSQMKGEAIRQELITLREWKECRELARESIGDEEYDAHNDF